VDGREVVELLDAEVDGRHAPLDRLDAVLRLRRIVRLRRSHVQEGAGGAEDDAARGAPARVARRHRVLRRTRRAAQPPAERACQLIHAPRAQPRLLAAVRATVRSTIVSCDNMTAIYITISYIIAICQVKTMFLSQLLKTA